MTMLTTASMSQTGSSIGRELASSPRSHNAYFIFATVSLSCRTIKKARDDYVKRLNGIYANNLVKDDVEYIPGHAKFISPTEVQVDGRTITAKHILIATGTKPMIPPNTPGEPLTGHCFS